MTQLVIAGAGALIGGAVAPAGFTFLGLSGAGIGWAVGSLIGGYITQPDGPTVEGPKIEDGSVTVSGYGQPLPKIWGTIPVAGNIIDATPLVTERTKSTSSSGKGGGPKQTTITYQQYIDYDVVLCEGEITGIVKIYANEKLIYDATPGSAISKPDWLNFTFYPGSSTQSPDPTFEAERGAGFVPAYLDEAHIVFRRFLVSEFGTTAINFRFLVTSSGARSVSSSVFNYTGDDADHLIWNATNDLVIGTIARTNVTPHTAVVAFDPYGQTAVWEANITDHDDYFNYVWLVSFSIPSYSDLGFPIHQPDELIGVLCSKNDLSSVRLRAIHVFDSASGASLARVDVEDSSGSPKIVAAYDDDSVIYQPTSNAVGSTFINRGVISSVYGWSSVAISAPDGYVYNGNNNRIIPYVGSRREGRDAQLLVFIENDTTGAYAVSVLTDSVAGLGSGAVTGIWTTPDEFPAASGEPADGVWDAENECWWVVEQGSTPTRPRFSRIGLDGQIVETIDWNTEFSITGTIDPAGDEILSLDTSTGLLWIILGGVAYSWPSWDTDQTPSTVGSGINGNPIVMHPRTGNLWTGDNNDPDFYVWDLDNLTSGTATLQEVSQDIVDAAPTELLSGDRDMTAGSGVTVRGFRVARQMSKAAALEQLRAAYLVDYVPRSGVLTLILRGGSSAATYDVNEIGAYIDGNTPPPALEISRRAEGALPRKLSVNFIDIDQNYEQGAQHAIRLASAGGTELTSNIAVALDNDEAAQLASITLHALHIESETYKTTLVPSTTFTAQPAAIITVTYDGSDYPMRLESASVIDGGIVEIEGRRHEASIYSDASVGGQTRNRTRSIEVAGSTQLWALDLPALRNADNNSLLYLAAYSYTPSWPGAAVFRSVDGVNYSQALTMTVESAMGYTTEALADGVAGNIEQDKTLNVRLLEGSLSSITFAAASTDKTSNYAALIRSDGTCEIIRYLTATQESDGTWTLSDGIYRGLRGTDNYTTGHAVGERFVVLSADTLSKLSIEESDISAQIYLKAVTFGKTIDDSAAVTSTPTGRSLKPYPPTQLDATWGGGGAITLSCMRQDRIKVQPFHVPPISEATESYTWPIYNGPTIVRTLTSTTDSVVYTQNQQETDFGIVQDNIKFCVAQQSAVVGSGETACAWVGANISAYDAAVLESAPVVYWKLDEPAAEGSAYDYSGNRYDATVTSATQGAASLTTDGRASVSFDATNDVIEKSNESVFQTGGAQTWEFVVELPSSYTSRETVFAIAESTIGNYRFKIDFSAANTLQTRIKTAGGNYDLTTTGVTGGTTKHIAMTWNGTTLESFVDGSPSSQISPSNPNFLTTAYPFRLGLLTTSTESQWFGGKLAKFAWYDSVLSDTTIAAHATLK